jgi:hypothetical protein
VLLRLPLHRLARVVPEGACLHLRFRTLGYAPNDGLRANRGVLARLGVTRHVRRVVAWADGDDAAGLVLELQRVVRSKRVQGGLGRIIDLRGRHHQYTDSKEMQGGNAYHKVLDGVARIWGELEVDGTQRGGHIDDPRELGLLEQGKECFRHRSGAKDIDLVCLLHKLAYWEIDLALERNSGIVL